MLHRMLMYLLALVLLNASPGLHWHEHSHEPVAAVQAVNEEPGSEDDAHGGCVECILQAQQMAAGTVGTALSLPAAAPPSMVPAGEREPMAQSPPAGAIRVRGPPASIA